LSYADPKHNCSRPLPRPPFQPWAIRDAVIGVLAGEFLTWTMVGVHYLDHRAAARIALHQEPIGELGVEWPARVQEGVDLKRGVRPGPSIVPVNSQHVADEGLGRIRGEIDRVEIVQRADVEFGGRNEVASSVSRCL
jgi:hypothetical protein